MASNYEAFPNYKTMPHPLREVILKALSFYPELVDIKIEFKINDNIRKSVMQAQPKFTSVADTYAVNQGLGDYILATKDFILHQAGMPEPYIQRILKLYMPPEEIMLLLENKLPEDD